MRCSQTGILRFVRPETDHEFNRLPNMLSDKRFGSCEGGTGQELVDLEGTLR